MPYSNREHQREYQRRYRQRNKERIAANAKRYREQNKERLSSYRKTRRYKLVRKLWLQKNKNRVNAYQRNWLRSPNGRAYLQRRNRSDHYREYQATQMFERYHRLHPNAKFYPPRWTENDIAFLFTSVSDKKLSQILHRTVGAIQTKRWKERRRLNLNAQ